MISVAPRVRLFSPDEHSALTLRQYYDLHLRRELGDQAPGSLQSDRTALRHWQRLTDDPPLDRLDRSHLEQLRDGLLAEGKRPATINKNWREIKAILEAAVEDGHCREVPRLARRMKSRLIPQSAKVQRDILTVAELTPIWQACSTATYPRPGGWHPTPKLWRVALVLFWLYGPRTWDVFNLTWDAFKPKARLLQFAAMKTRKLQGVPLTDLAIEHLESIRSRSRFLFPGFNSPGCYLTSGRNRGTWKGGVYTSWRREILTSAGYRFDPARDPAPVDLRHFRESMVTRHNRAKAGLGSWIAGHYVPGVSAQSYDLPTDEIAEAIERTEVPDCFREIG